MNRNRGTSWWLVLALLLAQAGTFDARRAQGGEVVILWSSLPGIARGQTLRITVGNVIAPEGSQPVEGKARAMVRLFDAAGGIVARSEPAAIGSGSVVFDFERSSISAPGEADTGRLQLRAELEVRGMRVNKIDALTVKQKIAQQLPVAIEVFTSATGRTQTTVKSYVLVDAWPVVDSGTAIDQPLTAGLAPGEKIRYTLFLADGSPTRASAPLRFVVADESGRVVVTSPYVRWPAGTLRSFEVERAALFAPGDAGTGRLQVRVHVEADPSFLSTMKPTLPAHGALEVIDMTSGATTVIASHPDFLWLPTGKSTP